jgi:hypothetical protein
VLNYSECAPLRELIDQRWAEHLRLAASGVLTPYVFTRSGGRPIRDFLDGWRSACRRAGLQGITTCGGARSAARTKAGRRAGFIDGEARALGLTLDQVRWWAPEVIGRGRGRKGAR